MPYIIDGYNLLRQIEKTCNEYPDITDFQMCHIISRYLNIIANKGEIIFDGVGPPDKSGFDHIGNLEIIFSGYNKDADTVIEEKTNANTAPKSLVVVSSDRRLRDAAKKRRAISVKSENFWAEVIKQLSKKRPKREPYQKKTGISDSETEKWLELFGLDQ